jgi:TonB family protein
MADHSMTENLPGKGLRVWYFHRYMVQREAEGLDGCALVALEALQDALLPGEHAQVPATQGEGAAQAVDAQPMKVRSQPPAPDYPDEAKEERVQGTVTVELLVDPTGVPRWATAIDGPKALMECACQYALTWRFEPAILNGVPQSARFRLPMPFKLR